MPSTLSLQATGMHRLLVHERSESARDDLQASPLSALVPSSRLDRRLLMPTLLRLADCNGSNSQHGRGQQTSTLSRPNHANRPTGCPINIEVESKHIEVESNR